MSYTQPSIVSAPHLDSDRAVSDAVQLMKYLDKGELQELIDSDDNLHSVLEDLEEVKKIEVHREMLMASNRSLAEYNLTMEPQLNSGRERLLQSHENREILQEQFDKNKQRLESLSDQFSPDTTMALLQTAAAEAEEEAEKTVDKFLEGELDIENFIRTFTSQKTLHHLRRVKSEKLTELLRQRSSSQCSYKF